MIPMVGNRELRKENSFKRECGETFSNAHVNVQLCKYENMQIECLYAIAGGLTGNLFIETVSSR